MDVAVTVEQCWHRVPGGTARSILELTRAMADSQPDVRLRGVAAAHRHPPIPAWRPSIPVSHLKVPRQVLYETWHAPAPLPPWPPVESATGPVDVIHATAIAFPPATAPVVVTIHDLAFLEDPSTFTRHGVRFFRRGTDLARRHARLVVVPSEATRRECLRAGFEPERLRVVPWGVAADLATPDAVQRVKRLHHLDRPYVLFAGTLEPRKNLGTLLAAHQSVLAGLGVDLVVVGPAGWGDSALVAPDATAAPAGGGGGRRPEGAVRPVGFVPRDHLDALMAGAVAFCYPSLREGFGLPVLEAMAQGTPVVTSLGTATEEVVGEAGITCDPADVDAVGAALASLVGDEAEAKRLGAAGQARAGTFTWEAAAAGYADAYVEALR